MFEKLTRLFMILCSQNTQNHVTDMTVSTRCPSLGAVAGQMITIATPPPAMTATATVIANPIVATVTPIAVVKG